MKMIEPCRFVAAPPYLSPWQREVPLQIWSRLRSWLQHLLTVEAVRVIEWVGADPRKHLHAVSIAFGDGPERGRIVIFKPAESITYADLQQAARAVSARRPQLEAP